MSKYKSATPAVQKIIILFLLASFPFVFTGCNGNAVRDISAEQTSGRAWAQPIDITGIENFHKVSDDLYRGRQPDAKGFEHLDNIGIKTVIDLRPRHSDKSKFGNSNFHYKNIGMEAWAPNDKVVTEFLQIVTDPNNHPVFVHCKAGADRTGLMCAVYRIVIQNWSKQHALEEMTQGGFNFHPQFFQLVDYINNLDIDKIKHQSGIN